MKSSTIIVHNSRKLEFFIEERNDGFEFWAGASIRGQRVLLGHHLTHDNVEAHLHYFQPGDLIWRDCEPSEIPTKKHGAALEDEETIKRGAYLDYDDPKLDELEAVARKASGLSVSSALSHRSVADHLGAIVFLAQDPDKEEGKAAKQAIIGEWTDGVVTMRFEPGNEMDWSCADLHHPFSIGIWVHRSPPDWWNFEMWGIALLNRKNRCGTRIGVLRVNEKELHLTSRLPHRIADVYRRVAPPGPIEKPEQPARSKGRCDVSRFDPGNESPLMRRLHKALTFRNPLLAGRLRPGLSESDIRNALNRASVAGAIEPLVELYSWRNGTALDESTPMEETSFFPVDVYEFLDLETALNQLECMNQAAAQLREMFEGTEAHPMFSGMSGQLFPLFSDGATGAIAVDLTPSKGNPVLAIEFESDEPMRQAYGSFQEFIKDAIRANRENNSLSCFQ